MKNNKEINIFREKKEFYSPDYPWALKLIDAQNDVFWKFNETNIEDDFHDLMHNLSESELHGIKETLKLFTLYETQIGNDYWAGLVRKVFNHPELQMLAATNSYFECVTPDTEVLTSEGWKLITDVTLNSLVAQFDLSTREISFVNPKELVSNYRDEELIDFDGKRLSQLVTKKHRIPVIGGTKFNRNEKKFIQADEVTSTGYYNIPLSGYKITGISEFTALDKFKVAAQADGKIISVSDSRYTGERSNFRPILFHFKKERKKQRILEILKELKFEYSQYTTNKPYDDGFDWFYVKVPLEYNVNDWKTFDWVDITKYSTEWFFSFIQELRNWDGQHNSKNIRYVNSVLSAHEKVQMIASMCGLVGSIEYRPAIDENHIDNYCTWISHKPHTTTRGISIKRTHYKGDVYCLVVDTGAFVVRRKGKVSITGNCIHSRAYNEINRCMGLDTEEFYTEYQHDPVLSDRISFIEKACEVPKDYNALDVLKSLGTFVFVEGAVIYSNFAYIKHFSVNGKNLLKNTNAAIDYSIRDEGNFHVTSGEMLFKSLKEEAELTPEELDELSKHLYKIARKTNEHEERIISKLFEKGEIPGITEAQLQTFVKSRINEVLQCLELDPLFDGLEENPIKDWFYNNVTSLKLTDFFYKKSAQYTRKWKKFKFTW